MENKVEQIFNHFNVEADFKNISILNSGHINDSFLINTNTEEKYVLQKMNGHVFKNIEDIIQNKVLLSEFLAESNSKYQAINFIKTNSGTYYFKDKEGYYWNLMLFFPNTVTHDVADSSKLVFEAGKLYADFVIQTSEINISLIKETLPKFHNMLFRYEQFEEALEHTTPELKANAKEAILFAQESKQEMIKLSQLKADQTFPIRITHNDAKLSNILFDKNNEGVAVIDLDTVMPGIIHFDFGDSIRSICTNAKEDDKNLDNVYINLEYYEAFCKGFSISAKGFLTDTEIEYLPLGAKTITFIMGLRMLTDYLNGSIYYKTDYKTHNLVRAQNQFQLVKSIQLNYKTIQEITNKVFKRKC